MFSPNRLLTRKEQALLSIFTLVVLAGTGALLWQARRMNTPAAPAAETAPAQTAPATAPPQAAMPPAPVQPAAQAAPVAAPTPPEKDIAVAVRGGVRREGLYRLPPDSRVSDLIMEAGGAAPGSDLSELNLAAPLVDGTTLTVPVAATAERAGDRIIARGPSHTAASNPAAYLGVAAPAPAPAPAPPPADGGVPAAATGGSSASGGILNLNTATQAELETLPGIGPALAQRIIAHRQTRPFQTVDELNDVSGIGDKRLEAVRALVTAP